MAATIFVVDVLVTLALAGALLFTYGNWMRQRLAVTLAVLVAWYFSFLIIFVLPLDVSNTAYLQCVNSTTAYEDSAFGNSSSAVSSGCQVPHSLLNASVLPSLWRIVYWSSQLLTWLVLPLMQAFTQAGEFTVWRKFVSSVWDNVIYYASYLFIALILVIYIALQPDLHLNWERCKAIAASASNTWGLFVLVLMLGYGLVEVPRNLWKRSLRGYQLNRAYFGLAKLVSERADSDDALDHALASVKALSLRVSQNDPQRANVETILRKIPLEMMERTSRGLAATPSLSGDTPTEKDLSRLHRQVIRAMQTHHRVEAQWSDLVLRAFDLEDINRNMISNEHVFKRTFGPERPAGSLLARTIYNPTAEWYWKCLINPLLLKMASCLAVLMSALVLWSEITFFSVHPPLSLFAVFVNLAKEQYNYVVIEAICFITICYLCLCTYYTIFKIRILNYYYLAGNHQSDEYTLLFSGALLCRLTPPLCLNFLSLIHMDSHVIHEQTMETAYTRIMGHMDVVSIVSDYFNVYFPIALLVLSASTYFSLGARCLSKIGFQQFLDQESEVTLDMIEEGKQHAKLERRRIQRLTEASGRKSESGGYGSSYTDAERGSEPRRRAGDILKSRSGVPQTDVSTPERSLLGTATGTLPNFKTESREATNALEMDIVIDEDQRSARVTNREPPRNIFDDF